MRKKLNDLKLLEEGKIVLIEANENIRKRLLDLGFTKGSLIRKILINHDLVAYKIKGSVIAVRKEDTEGIVVDV